MVKQGHFELVLVRAETGAPYEEHGAPGGSIFSEVEPDDQFYLQLSSGACEMVYADLSVDGQVIQKGHGLYPGGRTSRVGVVRANSHAGERTSTEVALRFARAQVHGGSTKGEACEYWTGQVDVTFWGNPSYRTPPGILPKPYKPAKSEENRAGSQVAAPVVPAPLAPVVMPVTYAAPKNTYFLNPSLASTDVGFVPGQSDDKHKKGVKSAEGTTALQTLNLNWEKPEPKQRDWNDDMSALTEYTGAPRVREPQFLGKITLKYCSAVGLIHAGILDKPPNWDVERLKLACSAQTKQDHARILSEVKIQRFTLNNERISGNGEKIVEKTEMEVLDLTEMGDD